MMNEKEKKSLINRCKDKISHISAACLNIKNSQIVSRKRILFGSAVLVIIVFAVTATQCHKNSKNESQTEKFNAIIIDQMKKSSELLINLQQQINDLTKALNTPQAVVDVDSLKQGLSQISSQIDTLQKDNATSLKEIMENENAVVNKKLDDLQAGVTELKDLQHPIKYLPAKELPFAVQSIDLIQQQPVVTIAYANKSQPLDLGYSVAGWELIKANYTQQRAEFKNKDDMHIVINLAMQGVST